MNTADALAELATVSPRCAELVEIIRKAQRGGRPPRPVLDADARRLAVIKAVRAALKAAPLHILSRSELLVVVKNIAPAKVLAGVLFDLEVVSEIRSETEPGPNGGRPQTLYMRT